jgi:hypothetical protein
MMLKKSQTMKIVLLVCLYGIAMAADLYGAHGVYNIFTDEGHFMSDSLLRDFNLVIGVYCFFRQFSNYGNIFDCIFHLFKKKTQNFIH